MPKESALISNWKSMPNESLFISKWVRSGIVSQKRYRKAHSRNCTCRIELNRIKFISNHGAPIGSI